MKLRHVVLAVAVPVIVYSGFSVSIAADADAATCCAGNGDCPDDYRCNYSQSCGTLPGQCVPQPAVERQVTP